MRYQKLKRIIVFAGIILMMFFCKSGNIQADVYKDGLFAVKHMELPVKQDGETKKLVPLIVQAFLVATPTQVISVTSYSYRMILSDKKNYCILFVADHSLNIAFGRIHMFQTFNDIMSEKKRYLVTRENPAKK